MEFTRLGRTNLQVSVMGLGCGGHSRLGQATGKTVTESVAIVKQALDYGVNFIDTAEAYGTEPIVGQALQGVPRGQVILSTKKSMYQQDTRITPEALQAGLERSLTQLGTDYIDVYHLHAVSPEDYNYARSELVPMLQFLREQGKVRHLGITEMFARDPQHAMLRMAVQDNVWDVMMVGFNILNQSARETIFPHAIEKDVGILIMFAVRRALRSMDNFRTALEDLRSQGLLSQDLNSSSALRSVLGPEGGAASLQDAAYRFCRYEPGVHVTLSGTGNAEHLAANHESLLRPPLPGPTSKVLRGLFSGIDSVSGN